MKTKLDPAVNHGRISMKALALAASILAPHASAAVLAVDLRSAADFAILAGSGITIAGPVNSSSITGDIGSFPTPTITGLENLVLNGTNQAGNAVTQQAKTDLSLAYGEAVLRPADTIYADGMVLSDTLISGVYSGTGSLAINGILTLDALGDSNAVWIIKAGSTLITASDSLVNLVNGAKAENVFWQVGSSATLGTGTKFAGTIMALQSITLTTGVNLDGRALALNGAVTIDQLSMTIPEPSSSLLLLCGLAWGASFRRRTALASA
jgi:hypothetical protein